MQKYTDAKTMKKCIRSLYAILKVSVTWHLPPCVCFCLSTGYLRVGSSRVCFVLGAVEKQLPDASELRKTLSAQSVMSLHKLAGAAGTRA